MKIFTKTLIFTFILWFSVFNLALASCNTNSAFFDGTNMYLKAASSDGSTEDITVEAWIRFDTLTFNNSEARIIGRHGASDAPDYAFFVDSYNAPGREIEFIYFQSGTAFTYRVMAYAFSIDTWYHLAVTLDASAKTITFYVNGTEYLGASTDSGGGATSIRNNGVPYIGSLGASGIRMFPGRIDEVRISNTIVYTAGFTPQTDDFSADGNTRVLYHFNTDLTTDSSGNSNTLTNTNSVTQSSTVPYVGTTCAGAAIIRNEQIIIFE